MSLISKALEKAAADYVLYAEARSYEKLLIESEISNWISSLIGAGAISPMPRQTWTSYNTCVVECRPHDDPQFVCQIVMTFPHITNNGTTPSSRPVSTDDAYDRAMKGI